MTSSGTGQMFCDHKFIDLWFSSQCLCCGGHRNLQVPRKGRNILIFNAGILIYLSFSAVILELLYKAELTTAWPFFF